MLRQTVITCDNLNATALYPDNIVVNEGVGGDETFDAAFVRIKSVLARHPDMTKALIMLGINDVLNGVPPGTGCSGALCDGTFKGNMQTLVDKIRWLDYPTNTVPSNIIPIVALTPPAWNSGITIRSYQLKLTAFRSDRISSDSLCPVRRSISRACSATIYIRTAWDM